MTMGIDAIHIFNDEAEQAILGAVFLDDTVAKEAVLQPDHFYREQHKRVWKAIKWLVDDGSPIDLVSITTKLQKSGELDEVGGVTYLSSLANAVPTAANFEYYQGLVLDAWKARSAAGILNGALEELAATRDTDLIGTTIQRLTTIDEQGHKQGDEGLSNVLVEIFEDTEAAMIREEELTGIQTAFRDLDIFTNGLQASDLIIVAARPSMGKTAFCLNVATTSVATAAMKIARAPKEKRDEIPPVGADIFSLEMPRKQIVRRQLCAVGNIDANRFRNPKRFFQSEDWDKLAVAISNLNDLDINVYDDVSITVQEIRAKVRRNVRKAREKHPGARRLIIIDYLQLIRGSGKAGNREQEIAEISRSLKTIARELDVTIVALSQLSRSVEQRQDKRPYMSDLRESGAIEQDADIIAFLYRDDYYNSDTDKAGIVEVIIAKHRNGPTGTIELAFLKQFNKFVNLDRGSSDVDRSNREGRSANRDNDDIH